MSRRQRRHRSARRRNAVGAGGLAVAACLVTGSVAEANDPIVVTNTNDSGAGSLRKAVITANQTAGPDTITFASNVTGEIDLTGRASNPAYPAYIPVYGSPVSIVGPGARTLTVHQTKTNPIFYAYVGVNPAGPGDLSVSGLTLSGGRANNGSGILADEVDLTLDQVRMTDNRGTGTGGAVYSISGNTTIHRSTFDNNYAHTKGGAIAISEAAGKKLTLDDSTLTGNSSAAGGALSLNDTGAGGFAILGSTITGNAATTSGGGISVVKGAATVTSTILSGNTATVQDRDVTTAPATPGSTPSVSFAYSLIGDPGSGTVFFGPQDLIGDPGIGALQNNGGPTDTMLPATGSRALDAGKATAGALTDQRGLARTSDLAGVPNPPGGDATDIGAVEVQAPPPIPPPPKITITPPPKPTPKKPKKPVLGTHGTAKLVTSHGRYVLSPGFTVSCPAAGSTCTLTLVATTKVKVPRKHKKAKLVTKTVVRKSFRVTAGKKSTLSVTLPKTYVTKLRAAKRLTLSFTLTGTAGKSSTARTTKTLTVHAPKAKTKR